MANEQQVVQVQQQAMETESVSELNIRDLISACFDKWYWFALSVLFCMTIAIFYILRTQPSYSREAMNPSLPQLMPRIGFLPAAAASAHLSMVPSPPITMTTSHSGMHCAAGIKVTLSSALNCSR